MIYTTTYEDENDNEIEIRLHYNYIPREEMQPNPDHPAFGPGCDAEVEITCIERKEEFINESAWHLWSGETEEQLEEWFIACLEHFESQEEEER